MAAGPEPDRDPRPAEVARRRWARVPRVLRPVVVIVQLTYYALCVWREL